MPIKISDSLPARAILESENIFVITEYRALHQDIRPLRLLILNLMPTKITTETQLLRCLSNTPLQIEIDLLKISSHKSKNTSEEHLLTFYKTFDQISKLKYDGFIITGAPVENMEFEEVDYWDELCDIMEWSKTNVFSTYHICWGAQAALHYHYGIKKYPLKQKMFGVYKHKILDKTDSLFRGFDDVFYAPHSRHTGVNVKEIEKVAELKLLSTSKEAGLYIAATHSHNQIFVMGHSEYDANTLADEYYRDLNKGMPIAMPANYFIDNDPKNGICISWKAHGHLLYTNWLNYYVYQSTPYDFTEND